MPRPLITGATRVVVRVHDLTFTIFTAALAEVLPEADERLPAIEALARAGAYDGGGGAAPAFTLTLAAP